MKTVEVHIRVDATDLLMALHRATEAIRDVKIELKQFKQHMEVISIE